MRVDDLNKIIRDLEIYRENFAAEYGDFPRRMAVSGILIFLQKIIDRLRSLNQPQAGTESRI
jgi:hypothetical protein